MQNILVIVFGLIACVIVAVIANLLVDPPIALLLSGVLGVPIGIFFASFWEY